MLYVENGVARVQERGGPVLTLRAGQTVVCAPGVEHWHGAWPESTMTQLAVTPAGEDGQYAQWGEQVTDGEYGRLDEPGAAVAPVAGFLDAS
ncbi:MAG: hypothetical protein M3Z75_16045 [Actinomycetota bacterium]|nr:hypothetical protein [Actinomycetota bacterium]